MDAIKYNHAFMSLGTGNITSQLDQIRFSISWFYIQFGKQHAGYQTFGIIIYTAFHIDAIEYLHPCVCMPICCLVYFESLRLPNIRYCWVS